MGKAGAQTLQTLHASLLLRAGRGAARLHRRVQVRMRLALCAAAAAHGHLRVAAVIKRTVHQWQPATCSQGAVSLSVGSTEVRLAQEQPPPKRRKLDLQPYPCPCCAQPCLRPVKLVAHLRACCSDLFTPQASPFMQHVPAMCVTNACNTCSWRTGGGPAAARRRRSHTQLAWQAASQGDCQAAASSECTMIMPQPQ